MLGFESRMLKLKIDSGLARAKARVCVKSPPETRMQKTDMGAY